MDNPKIKKALDRHNDFIEKTKLITLKSIVGQWAVECLREGTPMNASTLKAWSQSTTLKAGEKLVIDELLAEVDSLQ